MFEFVAFLSIDFCVSAVTIDSRHWTDSHETRPPMKGLNSFFLIGNAGQGKEFVRSTLFYTIETTPSGIIETQPTLLRPRRHYWDPDEIIENQPILLRVWDPADIIESMRPSRYYWEYEAQPILLRPSRYYWDPADPVEKVAEAMERAEKGCLERQGESLLCPTALWADTPPGECISWVN